MNIALGIIFSFLAITIYLSIQAKKGKDMSLEQWSVGGRGFGAILIFLLLAGEIFTTFTFLGAAGWAYRSGAAAYYVLCYLVLSFVFSYFLLPPIWRYGQKHKLVSQSDFFASKYNSPFLGVLVTLVGVMAMVPYLMLQFKGLGIIVSETSYGSISPSTAVWIGAVSLTVFVMISGIHGSARTAIIKDFMILVVVLFLGIYIPFHYHGGIQPMFEAVNAAKPGLLTFPEKGLSLSWFISTVLITVLGVHLWPHSITAVFSAKSANVFRKNAAVLPLYTLIMVLVFFVGYTAILQVPGLEGAEADLSLLRLLIKTFDPWIVGFIGAAGLLTALVPGSMLLMTSATLLSKNVYKVFVPSATEAHVAKVAKMLVPVITLIALSLTLSKSNTLANLLLVGLSTVTQLFPACFFSLLTKQFVNKYGAIFGIVCGVLATFYMTLTNTTIGTLFPELPQAFKDLNSGIIALLINVAVMLVVSFATRKAIAKNEQVLMEEAPVRFK